MLGVGGRWMTDISDHVDAVLDMLATTSNITEIAARVGLTRQTVLRIKSDPESAYHRVGRWIS